MFVQVMQGPCTRRDELRAVVDSWKADTGGAEGWLGATFGFTDDDQFIGVVRFASSELAMANSGRPEQDAWAGKFVAAFDGPVEFHDCTDVTVFLDGGSDDAGFVQVIRGHVDDRDLVRVMMSQTDSLRAMRPEIIGGTFAITDDGTFTQTVAFTDEASARSGEAGEPPPPDVRKALDHLMTGATFYDLREPWFVSA